jgi:2-oxoisovalerate dehydrogenase E2 component (dihydrolipoyl transacylase)
VRQQLSMPKLGESVTEGTVLRWLKSSGDRVSVDEPLVEIETEKVNVEIPSPWGGLLQLVSKEGDRVPVGAPLAYIETATVSTEPISTPAHNQPATPGQQRETDTRLRRTGRYSPVVQALAREHGVDLSQVQGTGVGGRVTRNDVLAILASRAMPSVEPAEAAPTSSAAEGLVALTPTRRIIAERMARSAQTVPHAWLMMEADVTQLVKLRHQIEPDFRRRHGTELTYLPFVVRVLAQALRAHPFFNSSWTDQGIVLKKDINIGVAVAAVEGLIVPVVRRADGFMFTELATRLADLTERARTRRLVIEDVQEGTFTLDNTGALGSVMSMPIINQPQAAIMTFEAIMSRPAVVEGEIQIREMVNLCLSFDHRIVDGANAAEFLKAVKQGLEELNPDSVLS